ncbi:Glycine-rich protein [Forsythia ovata]|uniref:Glycine-rich protein n=1 Tax=Forsythia ovata TaxID=205694 RepID=A0ABD1PHK5_9LAMI
MDDIEISNACMGRVFLQAGPGPILYLGFFTSSLHEHKKMGSKTILLLGLLAMVLIASQVAARELSLTSNAEEAEKTNGVDEAKYQGGRGGYGGYPGGGYGGNPGGGYGGGNHGGGYGGGNHGGGYGGGHHGGGGGGHCRYGCCGRGGYYRGGCKCCTYAGEAVDAKAEAKPQN